MAFKRNKTKRILQEGLNIISKNICRYLMHRAYVRGRKDQSTKFCSPSIYAGYGITLIR